MPAANLSIIVKMSGGSLPPNSRAGDVEVYDNGRLVIYETDTDIVERQLDRQQVLDILQFSRQSGFFQLPNILHDGGNAQSVPDVTISLVDSGGAATVTSTNYQRLKGEMRKEPFDMVYKKITDTAWDSYTNGKPPAPEPAPTPTAPPPAAAAPNLPFSVANQSSQAAPAIDLPSLDDLLNSANLDFSAPAQPTGNQPPIPTMTPPAPPVSKGPSLPPLPVQSQFSNSPGNATLPPLNSFAGMGPLPPQRPQSKGPQPQRPPNPQQPRPPAPPTPAPKAPPAQSAPTAVKPQPPQVTQAATPKKQEQPVQTPPATAATAAPAVPPQPKPPEQRPPEPRAAESRPQEQRQPPERPPKPPVPPTPKVEGPKIDTENRPEPQPRKEPFPQQVEPQQRREPQQSEQNTNVAPRPERSDRVEENNRRPERENRTQENRQPTPREERVAPVSVPAARIQMKHPPVGWEHTQELIGRLEESLKGKLLTFYVAEGHEVSMDDMRYLYSHLRKTGNKKTLYVLPIIPSGKLPVVWRMATLLREFGQEVIFVLPDAASVYTTMLALSGDSMMMNPLGYLSPIETTFTHTLLENDSPISLNEVLQAAQMSSVSFSATSKTKSAIEQTTQPMIHPLVVTAAQRQLALTQLLCGNLLKLSKNGPKAELEINRIVNQLTSSFLSSDYPITFQEVKDLGLVVKETTEEMNDLLWELIKNYSYLTQPVLAMRDNFRSVEQQSVIIESDGRRTLYYKEVHEDQKNERILDENNRWRELTMQLSISQNGKEHTELQWKELQISGARD